MRILLTNDDGYDAPGLAALWSAVHELGDVQVDVIAPAAGASGQSHVISSEIRYRSRQTNPFGSLITVEGTPADCVRVGYVLSGQHRPNWVISGINRGGNLGVDVYYSGTVAAAREAAILGIPALAVSQLVHASAPDDWTRTTKLAAAVIAGILRPDRSPLPNVDEKVHEQTSKIVQAHQRSLTDEKRPACWNVNFPLSSGPEGPPAVVYAPLSTDPLQIKYERINEEEGVEHLAYTGNYFERPAAERSDIAVAFGGQISISALPV